MRGIIINTNINLVRQDTNKNNLSMLTVNVLLKYIITHSIANRFDVLCWLMYWLGKISVAMRTDKSGMDTILRTPSGFYYIN